jgi:hypothetical protein
MNKLSGYSKEVEIHTPIIWWTLRAIEITTCFAIIANVIHHW